MSLAIIQFRHMEVTEDLTGDHRVEFIGLRKRPRFPLRQLFTRNCWPIFAQHRLLDPCDERPDLFRLP